MISPIKEIKKTIPHCYDKSIKFEPFQNRNADLMTVDFDFIIMTEDGYREKFLLDLISKMRNNIYKIHTSKLSSIQLLLELFNKLGELPNLKILKLDSFYLKIILDSNKILNYHPGISILDIYVDYNSNNFLNNIIEIIQTNKVLYMINITYWSFIDKFQLFQLIQALQNNYTLLQFNFSCVLPTLNEDDEERLNELFQSTIVNPFLNLSLKSLNSKFIKLCQHPDQFQMESITVSRNLINFSRKLQLLLFCKSPKITPDMIGFIFQIECNLPSNIIDLIYSVLMDRSSIGKLVDISDCPFNTSELIRTCYRFVFL
ncbi:hypothetical protein BC833DRAFT_581084 [Globomyces pollinis-pini]|nr:hypothetical protein BC833DRAFT_581084 [Globomyces pollinis-pini]